MSVLRIKPGELPELIDVENELHALQKEVGGYIECVTTSHDTVIICNEEGLLDGSRFNFIADGNYIFGTVLIAGVSGEEFCDIPEDAEMAYIAAWGVTKKMCDEKREELER